MFTGCETEKQRSNRRISNANAPGTRAQQTRQKNKDYEKYKTNETKYNPEAEWDRKTGNTTGFPFIVPKPASSAVRDDGSFLIAAYM